jgi:hypothetical protein
MLMTLESLPLLPAQEARLQELAPILDAIRPLLTNSGTMTEAYVMSRLDGWLWACSEPSRGSTKWALAVSSEAVSLCNGQFPTRLRAGLCRDHVYSRSDAKRRLLSTEPSIDILRDHARIVVVTENENRRLGHASGWAKYAQHGIELRTSTP